MDNERFDGFLDDAAHAVADLWEKNGGERIGDRELYTLNDLLTQFFGDKRG
jgi:hypothetical protein